MQSYSFLPNSSSKWSNVSGGDQPFKKADPPRFHRSPHALQLPTTKPSPTTKAPSTASTPWKATMACSKDRAIEGPSIKWRIGWAQAIPIWIVSHIGHCAETSATSGHGAHPSRPCSIKSRHKKHLLLEKVPGLRLG